MLAKGQKFNFTLKSGKVRTCYYTGVSYNIFGNIRYVMEEIDNPTQKALMRYEMSEKFISESIENGTIALI